MFERETIDPRKIVLCRRWTKLEWEANKQGKTTDELLIEFDKVGLRDKMLDSHHRQLETFDHLMELFGNPHYTVGDHITRSDVAGADLVTIDGGDGHASFTNHFIQDEKVVFVVADKVLSKAALYDFDIDSLRAIYPSLLRGEYLLEGWTRLQTILNGAPIAELGLSDVFIGAKSPLDMSRYTVNFNGVMEEQKTSGILVSTGTGSTGWGKKIMQTQMREDGVFLRTSPQARFIMREEPMAGISEYELVNGLLTREDRLEITSLSEMMISPDSYKNLVYDFPFGAKAEVRLASQPLRVVRSGVVERNKPESVINHIPKPMMFSFPETPRRKLVLVA